MKPGKMEDSSSNKIEMDVKISDNNTVTVTSRPNSPTTTSSSISTPPSKSSSTSHRSRKEKLVVRSFSTETNERGVEEPHILTREEYLREKRAQSNPTTPRGSRESSPVSGGDGDSSPHKNNNGIKDEEGQTNDVENKNCGGDSAHPSLDETDRQQVSNQHQTNLSLSKPNKSPLKYKVNKKKKHIKEERKDNKPPKIKKKYYISKKLRQQSQLPSPSTTPHQSSSSLIKSPSSATFVKNSSFPPQETFFKPSIPSTFASFIPRPPPMAKLLPTRPPLLPPIPQPPAERKLVKYNLLQESLPKQWFKDPSSSLDSSSNVGGANVRSKIKPSFTVPPPRRPSIASSTSNKKSNKVQPAPTKKTTNNKSGSSSEKKKKNAEIKIHCMSNEEHEAIQNSALLDAVTLSQGMEKLCDLVKNIDTHQLKIEGVTIPQICAEAVAKLVKVASEFPVGSSSGSVSSELTESNEDPVGNIAGNVENEENIESHPDHPFVHHAKNLIRNQGITKELKVLMEHNQDAWGSDGFNQLFHPMFPVVGGASFMKKSSSSLCTPPLPRIRVQELEILKELLTPDDHFELAEDELEMVKLYIELMRAELKAFKEDQIKAKRMTSILLDNNNKQSDQESESFNSGKNKIADAYAIPVKFSSQEEKSRIKSALPGLILSHEEVAEKILNGNYCDYNDDETTRSKSNLDSLKELKTRRLRNGKQVPLEKIRLSSENVKLKSKTTTTTKNTDNIKIIKERSSSSKKVVPPKPAKHLGTTKTISTVPPIQMDTNDNVFKTMKPVMTLRDGKELPYNQKGLDIFRAGDEPFFKIQVKPELFEKELNPYGLDGFGGLVGLGGSGAAGMMSSDEYSKKVDANMKRLRDGGKEYEYEYERVSKMINSGEDYGSKLYSDYTPFLEKERLLLGTTTSGSSSFIASPQHRRKLSFSSSTTTSGNATTAVLPLPSSSSSYISNNSSNNGYGVGRGGGILSSSSTSSTFPPSSPYSISNDGYGTGRGRGGGGVGNLSSPQLKQQQQQLARSRYSRQQHSSLYPPFENNHCSFTAHYCPFPRAPGSRFCISHVDEGATLQFERCKYFKDSRECGRFIPKADLNSLQVFCELHATIVANARRKKIKTERQREQMKSRPKNGILLTQLNNNLDRTKGAIMERNEDGIFSVRKELVEDENETLNDSSGSDSDDGEINVKKLIETFGDEDTDVEDDLDVDIEGLPFPVTAFGINGSHHPSDEYNYDCLRNAGYVTVDEVVKIYRQKLRQKKQLIGRFMEIEKIKFRHEWRKYCRETGWLKRQGVNFTTDPKTISKSTLLGPGIGMSETKVERYIQHEVKVHNDTNAVLNHHSNRGPRALLRHQILRKRHQIFTQSELKRSKFESKEESKICSRPRPAPLVICSFGSGGAGGMKCNRQSLPLSRFCPTHINEDKNQKLLRPCRFQYGPDGDDICSTPVLNQLEEFGCPIHAIPMLPKEPPPTLKENRGPKIEKDIEKVLVEVGDEEKAAAAEAEGILLGAGISSELQQDLEYPDEELEKEMEDLVGDEMVDMDHLRGVVRSIYGKGLYVTDSEESDDTDEEEEDDETTTTTKQQPETAAFY